MRSLPRTAQVYVALVCLAGLASAAVISLPSFPGPHQWGWQLGLFVSLAVVAGGKKIILVRRNTDNEACSLTLGFAISFVALVHSGAAGGALVAAASCLASCLYPHRLAAHQVLFNVALSCLETMLGGLVFFHLNGPGDPDGFRSFRAITASCLVFFGVNTGAVALVIALCTGQSARRLWRDTLLWTAPSYFAGAGIGALMLILSRNGIGNLFLFGAPLAFLTYQSYAVTATRSVEKQAHIDALQASQAKLSDLYLATVKSLALAIDAKDQYTHQHILRVQRYAVATAGHMGLAGAEMEGLNTGALLHDIGKLGVPEYLLLKAGPLTAEEYAQVKKHPEIGAAILDPVEFPWPVLPVVRSHHERWDGAGYPEGLRGEAIPLAARILSVCDVYDALTSDRSYRQAWSHAAALHEIRRGIGTQFDPVVVEAFLTVIDAAVGQKDGVAPGVRAGEARLLAADMSAASKSEQAALDIQRANAEPWTLFEVIGILSAGDDLQQTLLSLVQKLERLYPGAACLFLTRDLAGRAASSDDHDVLLVRAAAGANETSFAGGRTARADGRTLQVARDRETYVGDYDGSDLAPGFATTDWTRLRSTLIVPVVYQDEALGTINLYHPQAGAFSLHDRYLLETIAARAATTLYHGLLFDETRSHAFTDPLTGLHNVRYLTQMLHRLRDEAEASPATDGRFALLYLDLDRFKSINDSYGHRQGDRVLCDLAQAFRGAVRERDAVVRYGGDEFVIVLPEAGEREAGSMADRLQGIVEAYDPGLVHPSLGHLRLGVSVGFGCFPQDGRDSEALLSAADAQMYCNKTERKLGTRLDSAGQAVLRRTLLGGALERQGELPLVLSRGPVRPARARGKKKCLATARTTRRFRFKEESRAAESASGPGEGEAPLRQAYR